jgi:amino acid adenylation domain-containing protein
MTMISASIGILPGQTNELDIAHQTLSSRFQRSALSFRTRPALEVDGQILTYEDLYNKAVSLAATLAKHSATQGPPLTAVFAYRSVTAFAGILGAVLRGHGYVPLNRTFPTDRTRTMLNRSKCSSLIVDRESESQLERILTDVSERFLIILPDRDDVDEVAHRWPQHVVIGARDLERPPSWRPPRQSLDAIAYLLFTSGSTGIPKGVMVSNGNVGHYVDWTVKRYGITEEDRVSQNFDLTFDLSAHDMFVAWNCGACVCCPTQKQAIKPGTFINESRLSIWFSVPSTAVFMRRLGQLKPGMYPNLRLSLFCGEALTVETVNQWAIAAPNSIIENIYGPTELTIACTAYRWHAVKSPAESEQGVVPIGEPFDGMDALIVDEQLSEVPDGRDGELLMTGPQLTLGYWQDEEKTQRSFVVPRGRSQTYYRTGDRVRRSMNGGPILYIGRMDNQIKILGHRVELAEIEAAVREISGVDGIVAIGWPVTPSGADGVEVFLQTDPIDTKSLKEKVRSRLPFYMVPRTIHQLSKFPLNANGKYDRRALIKILEEMK